MAEFPTPEQVKTIAYSGEDITVTLVDGSTLKTDYALISFSLGVLQNDDVTWGPELPAWKTEAVQSMSMVSGFLSLRPMSLTSHTGCLYEDLHAVPRKVLVRH